MKNNTKNKVLGVWGTGAAIATGLLVSSVAQAGIEDVPGLTEAQTNAAVAVEQIYTELANRVDNGEILSSEEQGLLDEAEEIVHTGNQVLNLLNGSELPVGSSLNLDAEGFAAVLQWVTHEEISAQGKLSGEALGAQSSNIGARLDALRMGARGFQLAWNHKAYPNTYRRYLGGNASAESNGAIPKWGAFINGGAGSGERDPTDREDAFDFDTWSITTGVDYRLTNDIIVGVALGVIESSVDFDSSKSIVEGEIETDTWLITGFTSYQWNDLYVDGSLTYGETDFDLERRISYPSQNVFIAATNELALASTEGDLLSITVQGGWVFTKDNWSYGPTFSMDYVDTGIDGYTETNADEFNLTIQGQDIESLTSRLGGRVQVSLNQTWGVLVPQVDLEWIHEYEDDARQVGAKFADDVTNTFFNVITDDPDDDYLMVALSLSAVFQQGIQGFISYKTTRKLENVDSSFITGGARWEF